MAGVSNGQTVPRPQDSRIETQTAKSLPSRYRLLSWSEGRKIVRAAWAHERSDGAVQDCSHVVNDIYRAAGFDYAYASSFDLYRGIAGFVRVQHAHPGDLIVWPGHAGIVLNASEHSFYSLVSTGFEAQNYSGAYWRGRGHPRFYRFALLAAQPSKHAKARRGEAAEYPPTRTTRPSADPSSTADEPR